MSNTVKAGKLLLPFSNPFCTMTKPASKLVLEIDSCTGTSSFKAPRKARVIGGNPLSVLLLLFTDQSMNSLEKLQDTRSSTEQQRNDGVLNAILNYIKRGSLSYRHNFYVQK